MDVVNIPSQKMIVLIVEEKLEVRILQGFLRRTNGGNIGGSYIKKILNALMIESLMNMQFIILIIYA